MSLADCLKSAKLDLIEKQHLLHGARKLQSEGVSKLDAERSVVSDLLQDAVDSLESLRQQLKEKGHKVDLVPIKTKQAKAEQVKPTRHDRRQSVKDSEDFERRAHLADRRFDEEPARKEVLAKYGNSLPRGAVEDIIKAKKAEHDATLSAMTDGLTGIGKREYGEQLIAEYAGKNGISPDAVPMLIFDGNAFKTINDKLGHSSGDEIIKLMAQSLKGIFGHRAVRWGGDEFAVIGVREAELQGLAERVQKAVDETAVQAVFGDGTSDTYTGKDFNFSMAHGFGRGFAEADSALLNNKGKTARRKEDVGQARTREEFEQRLREVRERGQSRRAPEDNRQDQGDGEASRPGGEVRVHSEERVGEAQPQLPTQAAEGETKAAPADLGSKPLYHRAEPGQGIGLDALKKVEGRFRPFLAADVQVESVQSIGDLPLELQAKMAQDQAEESPGVFWNGTTYLIADNMPNERGAAFTLSHELFHQGVVRLTKTAGSMGGDVSKAAKKVEGVLREVFLAKGPEIRTLVKEGKYSDIDLKTEEGRLKAANEWLANKAYQSKGKWYDRYVVAVRDFLRAIGKAVGVNLEFSDAEIRVFISNVGEALTKGEGGVKAGRAPTYQRGPKLDKAMDYGRRVVESARKWAQVVDDALGGKLHHRAILQVGKTPDLLIDVGLPDLPLIMEKGTLDKVLGIAAKRNNIHGLTKDQVARLYEQLSDPLAVLKSASSPNSFVVLTEMLEGGSPIIAAIHADLREGRIFVNEVASAYGKDNFHGWFRNQAQAGNLLYVDKNRTAAFLKDMSGLQLAGVLRMRLPGKKLLTENDVVKPVMQENSPQGETEAHYLRSIPEDDGDGSVPGYIKRIRGIAQEIWENPFAQGERLDAFLIRVFQDKFKRLKDVQKSITDQGGELPEAADAYMKETLFHGKIGNDIEWFESAYVEPLIKDMSRLGIRPDELGDYLYAKHAPERNAHIQKINPEFAEKGIPGSGMSDAEAERIISNAKISGKSEGLETLAKQIYAMNKKHLELLSRYGLIDQDHFDTLTKQYQFYVPLKGRGDKASFPRIGKGFDVRSSGIKRALGRASRAENPVLHSISQFTEGMITIRKNEVSQAFLGMVRAYPDESVWSLGEHKSKAKWNPSTEEVEYVGVPPMLQQPNILGVIENGKHVYIEMKDPLLARAMKNVGVEKNSLMTKAFGKINRYLAAVNTSLNPEFVITNFIRDMQTASINLSAEQSAAIAKRVAKDVPQALRAAWNGYFQKAGKSEEWGKWYREYRSSGASIGFFGLQGIDQLAKNVEKEFKKAGPGRLAATRRAFTSLGDFISNANAAVENAVRLSAYKNARESGLSQAKAANIAKNLTVNFNRKGEIGAAMNSMYLFFNAGMQGSARVVQTLKSKRGRQIGVGIVAAGFIMAELNRLMAGDDDDDENYYDKIGNNEAWQRERNIMIMLPDSKGKYVKLPLPYGFNVFWVVGDQISHAIHSRNPLVGAKNIIVAAANAFNPMGGESTLLRMISPTASDPLVDVATNENFAGYSIKPEQNPFGVKKPDSELYFKSVNPVLREFSEWMNSHTGGNAVRPGWASFSPEVLEYWIGEVTGSAGMFVSRLTGLAGKALSSADDEIEIRQIPFVRVVSGEISPQTTSKEYRAASDEMQRLLAEGKRGLLENGKQVAPLYMQYRFTDKALGQAYKIIEEIETADEVKLKKILTATGAKSRGELIERLEDRVEKTKKGFVKQYNKVMDAR